VAKASLSREATLEHVKEALALFKGSTLAAAQQGSQVGANRATAHHSLERNLIGSISGHQGVCQPRIKVATWSRKNCSGLKWVWLTQADSECFHMLTKKIVETKLKTAVSVSIA
jgi:hypothetical protein